MNGQRKEKWKALLGQIVKVKIDRPLGSVHPKYKDMIYPINYAYLPDILGGDGEEQDAYILGVNVPVIEYEGRVIGVVYRKNDREDKLLVAPVGIKITKEEAERAVSFQEKYFDSEIVLIE